MTHSYWDERQYHQLKWIGHSLSQYNQWTYVYAMIRVEGLAGSGQKYCYIFHKTRYVQGQTGHRHFSEQDTYLLAWHQKTSFALFSYVLPFPPSEGLLYTFWSERIADRIDLWCVTSCVLLLLILLLLLLLLIAYSGSVYRLTSMLRPPRRTIYAGMLICIAMVSI